MTKNPNLPLPPYAKGITRIDDDRKHSHGWKATVSRLSGTAQRLFGDKTHGSRKAAYEQAVAWVNEQFKKYPANRRVDYINFLRRNNRSGVPGVYRYPADGSDRPGAYWGTKWVASPNTPPKSRKFSIAVYGESQAKWLAIQARIKGIEATIGVEFVERSTCVYRKKNRSS